MNGPAAAGLLDVSLDGLLAGWRLHTTWPAPPGHRAAGTECMGGVSSTNSALVAGIKARLLAAIHAGSCDSTATLAIQGTEVQMASMHLDLPGVLRVSPGIRLRPAGEYPAGRSLPQRGAGAQPA